MKDLVQVVLVGLGGYGGTYVGKLLDAGERHGAKLVAGVDPNPAGCKRLADLQARGIPIWDSLPAFFDAGGKAHLVIIAAPIHLHAPLTELALANGASVLCEKPLSATVQEARAMREAELRSPGFVAIGYQWSFATAIQAIKKDVLSGAFGAPLSLRCLVAWPRRRSYYARNSWAGMQKSGHDRWVLDSPVNNATAHYLHNMFYIIGPTRETSTALLDVQAELYRANDITNYDTGFLRAHAENGTEILFCSSHAVQPLIGPVCEYRFENAVVSSTRGARFAARWHDGRTKDYGSTTDGEDLKLWDCVDAVRTGARPACGIEAATAQTVCMNGAQDSTGGRIEAFPASIVAKDDPTGDTLLHVADLPAIMIQCYGLGRLPSEIGGIDWARPGRKLDLRGYDVFPSA